MSTFMLVRYHDIEPRTGQRFDVLSGKMREHLGVYADTIFPVGVQTIWNLDERQRGVLVGIEEVCH